MRLILALVFAVIFALLSSFVGGPVVAQAQAGTPGPAACRVAPRSITEIRRMIAALPTEVPRKGTQGTPPPEVMVEVSGPQESLDLTIGGTPLVVDGTVVATLPPRTPSPSPPPPSPPPGEPADPRTAAEIAAAVHELVACANTGDSLRVYALFTDAFLEELLANVVPTGDEEAFLESLTTPPPAVTEEEDEEPIPTLEEVRVLSDGRAGARLRTDPSTRDDFFVFARVGDRWLLDDVTRVSRREALGTPSP